MIKMFITYENTLQGMRFYIQTIIQAHIPMNGIFWNKKCIYMLLLYFILILFHSRFLKIRANSHVQRQATKRLKKEERKTRYFNALSYSLHWSKFLLVFPIPFYPKSFATYSFPMTIQHKPCRISFHPTLLVWTVDASPTFEWAVCTTPNKLVPHYIFLLLAAMV